METEYIRGKIEERNGALSARPAARFTPRGNDVWAHRSGRVYQAPVEGGAQDFSSPVTGNGVIHHGMGRLGNLVGASRRAPSQEPGPKLRGGVEHFMSPEDAKRLLMMDYRGGRHPYLTRGGAVRRGLKGTGIWDNIKSLAGKVANEFTNPESDLRSKYAKNIADLAEYIPDERVKKFGKLARNLEKGEYRQLGEAALDAYDKSKKSGQRSATGKTLGEIAGRLKGKPKPTPLMLEDGHPGYKWKRDYNAPPKRAPPDDESYLMLEDAPPQRLMLEDAPPQRLMLEDAPRPKKKSRVQQLKDAWAIRDAAKAARNASSGRGGARSRRGAIVAKVMRERGVSLPEASRIVKAEGLA